MNRYVCNYSIIRFLPYRETGEFVNIGVVLSCPELGFFDYRIEYSKRKRVSDFFPELNPAILQDATKHTIKELHRFRSVTSDSGSSYLFSKEMVSQFQEITKPRESLINFGETGTVLSGDPASTLKALFDDAVRRRFAQEREYQETAMTRRLSKYMAEWNLSRIYRRIPVGNEDYRVIFPFVYCEDQSPIKAIKPLDLDKPDSSGIYDHGDDWIAKVRRLDRTGSVTPKILFAAKMPEVDSARTKAAQVICTELRDLHADVLDFEEVERIHQWAADN